MNIIEEKFFTLKRKAKTGCLDSALEVAGCYGEGRFGVEKNQSKYLQKCLALLGRLDELKASPYSTASIFYEIMYIYLERSDFDNAEYFHYHLMWEILSDSPFDELEPLFDKYQVREVGEFLGIDAEKTIKEVKDFQSEHAPENYKIIDVNHFFTI